MTVSAIARITSDEARTEARKRLSEVLADIVPGFRTEKAFRCLNPDHEDRHPSMRYLSRANMVKCFSCGWSGDVFDVVGAAYCLTGGDKFKKTYGLLGIDAGRGGYSHPVKPNIPKPEPGSMAEIISLIYPPGWDAPEPDVKLPEPLEVTARAENGLVGWMVGHSGELSTCRRYGLEGWHFDDSELDETCRDLLDGASLEDYGGDFLAWLQKRAVPGHMVPKLVRFVVAEGQRRKLEALFADTYSHLQNQEPVTAVLENLFLEAGRITGDRYALPTDAEAERVASDLFAAWVEDENPLTILALAGLSFVDIEERAAVLEFDCGMSRVEADRKAMADALRERRADAQEAARCFAG